MHYHPRHQGRPAPCQPRCGWNRASFGSPAGETWKLQLKTDHRFNIKNFFNLQKKLYRSTHAQYACKNYTAQNDYELYPEPKQIQRKGKEPLEFDTTYLCFFRSVEEAEVQYTVSTIFPVQERETHKILHYQQKLSLGVFHQKIKWQTD